MSARLAECKAHLAGIRAEIAQRRLLDEQRRNAEDWPIINRLPTQVDDTVRGLEMIPLTLEHAAILASQLGRSLEACTLPAHRDTVLDAAEALSENFHPALYDDVLFRRAALESSHPRPMETGMDAALRVLIDGVRRWQDRRRFERQRDRDG